jgi:hypothetical protein
MVFDGYIEPKTSFSINVATTAVTGRNTVHLEAFNEKYNIKYCHVSVKSIFWGTSRIELTDQLVIFCPQSGLLSEINFDGENVSGNIIVKKQNKKIFTISGKVSAVLAKDLVNNKGYKVYEKETLKEPSIKVADIKDQENNESRKYKFLIKK